MRRVLAVAAMTLALAACKADQTALENLGAAQSFLAENARKPGVKTLP